MNKHRQIAKYLAFVACFASIAHLAEGNDEIGFVNCTPRQCKPEFARTMAAVPRDAQLRIRVDHVGKGELRLFEYSLESGSLQAAYPKFGFPVPAYIWQAGPGGAYSTVPGRNPNKLTAKQILKAHPTLDQMALALSVYPGSTPIITKVDEGYKITFDGGWELTAKIKLAGLDD